MDKVSRENIQPKRSTHTKGTGAYGYFLATENDIIKHCKSNVFNVNHKKIRILVRFSIGGDESTLADTVRNPRGFAVKFFTDEGIWDLVGSSTPVFYIRDPALLPTLVAAQKRYPVTQFKDVNKFWDFLTTPEATHMAALQFSDRGIPDGYRYMNGYGVNTFKLVNALGQIVFCKFHFKTDQGILNLTPEKAFQLIDSDPDYATRDLYQAIQTGLYPTWTMCVQIMSLKEAESCNFNPFDPTKVWPHQDFPLTKVGQIVLDRNPSNFFEEIELASFSPIHLIPGIEPSQDKILQKRCTAYAEAQEKRLGLIPDDSSSESSGTKKHPNDNLDMTEEVGRDELRYIDDFAQAGVFYRKVLDFDEKSRLVTNIVNQLLYTKDFIQDRAVTNFSEADPDFGRRIQQQLEKIKKKRSVGLVNKLFLVSTETIFSLFQ